MGADDFVVPSDYPHSDGAFPASMRQFLGLKLNDKAKSKILWDNRVRLDATKAPAEPLSREYNAASAAE